MSEYSDDQFSDEAAALRRDEVVKRMLATPPQPRVSPPKADKPKARPKAD